MTKTTTRSQRYLEAQKAQTEKRASVLSVEITDNVQLETLFADAPAGHRFVGTGTHAVVADYDRPSKADAFAALLSDFEFGVEPCLEGGDDECRAADCAAWSE